MGKMRKIGKELDEKHILSEENIVTIIMHAQTQGKALLSLTSTTEGSTTHLTNRGFIKYHKQCNLLFTIRIVNKL